MDKDVKFIKDPYYWRDYKTELKALDKDEFFRQNPQAKFEIMAQKMKSGALMNTDEVRNLNLAYQLFFGIGRGKDLNIPGRLDAVLAAFKKIEKEQPRSRETLEQGEYQIRTDELDKAGYFKEHPSTQFEGFQKKIGSERLTAAEEKIVNTAYQLCYGAGRGSALNIPQRLNRILTSFQEPYADLQWQKEYFTGLQEKIGSEKLNAAEETEIMAAYNELFSGVTVNVPQAIKAILGALTGKLNDLFYTPEVLADLYKLLKAVKAWEAVGSAPNAGIRVDKNNRSNAETGLLEAIKRLETKLPEAHPLRKKPPLEVGAEESFSTLELLAEYEEYLVIDPERLKRDEHGNFIDKEYIDKVQFIEQLVKSILNKVQEVENLLGERYFTKISDFNIDKLAKENEFKNQDIALQLMNVALSLNNLDNDLELEQNCLHMARLLEKMSESELSPAFKAFQKESLRILRSPLKNEHRPLLPFVVKVLTQVLVASIPSVKQNVLDLAKEAREDGRAVQTIIERDLWNAVQERSAMRTDTGLSAGETERDLILEYQKEVRLMKQLYSYAEYSEGNALIRKEGFSSWAEVYLVCVFERFNPRSQKFEPNWSNHLAIINWIQRLQMSFLSKAAQEDIASIKKSLGKIFPPFGGEAYWPYDEGADPSQADTKLVLAIRKFLYEYGLKTDCLSLSDQGQVLIRLGDNVQSFAEYLASSGLCKEVGPRQEKGHGALWGVKEYFRRAGAQVSSAGNFVTAGDIQQIADLYKAVPIPHYRLNAKEKALLQDISDSSDLTDAESFLLKKISEYEYRLGTDPTINATAFSVKNYQMLDSINAKLAKALKSASAADDKDTYFALRQKISLLQKVRHGFYTPYDGLTEDQYSEILGQTKNWMDDHMTNKISELDLPNIPEGSLLQRFLVGIIHGVQMHAGYKDETTPAARFENFYSALPIGKLMPLEMLSTSIAPQYLLEPWRITALKLAFLRESGSVNFREGSAREKELYLEFLATGRISPAFLEWLWNKLPAESRARIQRPADISTIGDILTVQDLESQEISRFKRQLATEINLLNKSELLSQYTTGSVEKLPMTIQRDAINRILSVIPGHAEEEARKLATGFRKEEIGAYWRTIILQHGQSKLLELSASEVFDLLSEGDGNKVSPKFMSTVAKYMLKLLEQKGAFVPRTLFVEDLFDRGYEALADLEELINEKPGYTEVSKAYIQGREPLVALWRVYEELRNLPDNVFIRIDKYTSALKAVVEAHPDLLEYQSDQDLLIAKKKLTAEVLNELLAAVPVEQKNDILQLYQNSMGIPPELVITGTDTNINTFLEVNEDGWLRPIKYPLEELLLFGYFNPASLGLLPVNVLKGSWNEAVEAGPLSATYFLMMQSAGIYTSFWLYRNVPFLWYVRSIRIALREFQDSCYWDYTKFPPRITGVKDPAKLLTALTTMWLSNLLVHIMRGKAKGSAIKKSITALQTLVNDIGLRYIEKGLAKGAERSQRLADWQKGLHDVRVLLDKEMPSFAEFVQNRSEGDKLYKAKEVVENFRKSTAMKVIKGTIGFAPLSMGWDWLQEKSGRFGKRSQFGEEVFSKYSLGGWQLLGEAKQGIVKPFRKPLYQPFELNGRKYYFKGDIKNGKPDPLATGVLNITISGNDLYLEGDASLFDPAKTEALMRQLALDTLNKKLNEGKKPREKLERENMFLESIIITNTLASGKKPRVGFYEVAEGSGRISLVINGDLKALDVNKVDFQVLNTDLSVDNPQPEKARIPQKECDLWAQKVKINRYNFKGSSPEELESELRKTMSECRKLWKEKCSTPQEMQELLLSREDKAFLTQENDLLAKATGLFELLSKKVGGSGKTLADNQLSNIFLNMQGNCAVNIGTGQGKTLIYDFSALLTAVRGGQYNYFVGGSQEMVELAYKDLTGLFDWLTKKEIIKVSNPKDLKSTASAEQVRNAFLTYDILITPPEHPMFQFSRGETPTLESTRFTHRINGIDEGDYALAIRRSSYIVSEGQLQPQVVRTIRAISSVFGARTLDGLRRSFLSKYDISPYIADDRVWVFPRAWVPGARVGNSDEGLLSAERLEQVMKEYGELKTGAERTQYLEKLIAGFQQDKDKWGKYTKIIDSLNKETNKRKEDALVDHQEFLRKTFEALVMVRDVIAGEKLHFVGIDVEGLVLLSETGRTNQGSSYTGLVQTLIEVMTGVKVKPSGGSNNSSTPYAYSTSPYVTFTHTSSGTATLYERFLREQYSIPVYDLGNRIPVYEYTSGKPGLSAAEADALYEYVVEGRNNSMGKKIYDNLKGQAEERYHSELNKHLALLNDKEYGPRYKKALEDEGIDLKKYAKDLEAQTLSSARDLLFKIMIRDVDINDHGATLKYYRLRDALAERICKDSGIKHALGRPFSLAIETKHTQIHYSPKAAIVAIAQAKQIPDWEKYFDTIAEMTRSLNDTQYTVKQQEGGTGFEVYQGKKKVATVADLNELKAVPESKLTATEKALVRGMITDITSYCYFKENIEELFSVEITDAQQLKTREKLSDLWKDAVRQIKSRQMIRDALFLSENRIDNGLIPEKLPFNHLNPQNAEAAYKACVELIDLELKRVDISAEYRAWLSARQAELWQQSSVLLTPVLDYEQRYAKLLEYFGGDEFSPKALNKDALEKLENGKIIKSVEDSPNRSAHWEWQTLANIDIKDVEKKINALQLSAEEKRLVLEQFWANVNSRRYFLFVYAGGRGLDFSPEVSFINENPASEAELGQNRGRPHRGLFDGSFLNYLDTVDESLGREIKITTMTEEELQKHSRDAFKSNKAEEEKNSESMNIQEGRKRAVWKDAAVNELFPDSLDQMKKCIKNYAKELLKQNGNDVAATKETLKEIFSGNIGGWENIHTAEGLVAAFDQAVDAAFSQKRISELGLKNIVKKVNARIGEEFRVYCENNNLLIREVYEAARTHFAFMWATAFLKECTGGDMLVYRKDVEKKVRISAPARIPYLDLSRTTKEKLVPAEEKIEEKKAKKEKKVPEKMKQDIDGLKEDRYKYQPATRERRTDWDGSFKESRNRATGNRPLINSGVQGAQEIKKPEVVPDNGAKIVLEKDPSKFLGSDEEVKTLEKTKVPKVTYVSKDTITLSVSAEKLVYLQSILQGLDVLEQKIIGSGTDHDLLMVELLNKAGEKAGILPEQVSLERLISWLNSVPSNNTISGVKVEDLRRLFQLQKEQKELGELVINELLANSKIKDTPQNRLSIFKYFRQIFEKDKLNILQRAANGEDFILENAPLYEYTFDRIERLHQLQDNAFNIAVDKETYRIWIPKGKTEEYIRTVAKLTASKVTKIKTEKQYQLMLKELAGIVDTYMDKELPQEIKNDPAVRQKFREEALRQLENTLLMSGLGGGIYQEILEPCLEKTGNEMVNKFKDIDASKLTAKEKQEAKQKLITAADNNLKKLGKAVDGYLTDLVIEQGWEGFQANFTQNQEKIQKKFTDIDLTSEKLDRLDLQKGEGYRLAGLDTAAVGRKLGGGAVMGLALGGIKGLFKGAFSSEEISGGEIAGQMLSDSWGFISFEAKNILAHHLGITGPKAGYVVMALDNILAVRLAREQAAGALLQGTVNTLGFLGGMNIAERYVGQRYLSKWITSLEKAGRMRTAGTLKSGKSGLMLLIGMAAGELAVYALSKTAIGQEWNRYATEKDWQANIATVSDMAGSAVITYGVSTYIINNLANQQLLRTIGGGTAEFILSPGGKYKWLMRGLTALVSVGSAVSSTEPADLDIKNIDLNMMAAGHNIYLKGHRQAEFNNLFELPEEQFNKNLPSLLMYDIFRNFYLKGFLTDSDILKVFPDKIFLRALKQSLGYGDPARGYKLWVDLVTGATMLNAEHLHHMPEHLRAMGKSGEAAFKKALVLEPNRQVLDEELPKEIQEQIAPLWAKYLQGLEEQSLTEKNKHREISSADIAAQKQAIDSITVDDGEKLLRSWFKNIPYGQVKVELDEFRRYMDWDIDQPVTVPQAKEFLKFKYDRLLSPAPAEYYEKNIGPRTFCGFEKGFQKGFSFTRDVPDEHKSAFLLFAQDQTGVLVINKTDLEDIPFGRGMAAKLLEIDNSIVLHPEEVSPEIIGLELPLCSNPRQKFTKADQQRVADLLDKKSYTRKEMTELRTLLNKYEDTNIKDIVEENRSSAFLTYADPIVGSIWGWMHGVQIWTVELLAKPGEDLSLGKSKRPADEEYDEDYLELQGRMNQKLHHVRLYHGLQQKLRILERQQALNLPLTGQVDPKNIGLYIEKVKDGEARDEQNGIVITLYKDHLLAGDVYQVEMVLNGVLLGYRLVPRDKAPKDVAAEFLKVIRAAKQYAEQGVDIYVGGSEKNIVKADTSKVYGDIDLLTFGHLEEEQMNIPREVLANRFVAELKKALLAKPALQKLKEQPQFQGFKIISASEPEQGKIVFTLDLGGKKTRQLIYVEGQVYQYTPYPYWQIGRGTLMVKRGDDYVLLNDWWKKEKTEVAKAMYQAGFDPGKYTVAVDTYLGQVMFENKGKYYLVKQNGVHEISGAEFKRGVPCADLGKTLNSGLQSLKHEKLHLAYISHAREMAKILVEKGIFGVSTKRIGVDRATGKYAVELRLKENNDWVDHIYVFDPAVKSFVLQDNYDFLSAVIIHEFYKNSINKLIGKYRVSLSKNADLLRRSAYKSLGLNEHDAYVLQRAVIKTVADNIGKKTELTKSAMEWLAEPSIDENGELGFSIVPDKQNYWKLLFREKAVELLINGQAKLIKDKKGRLEFVFTENNVSIYSAELEKTFKFGGSALKTLKNEAEAYFQWLAETQEAKIKADCSPAEWSSIQKALSSKDGLSGRTAQEYLGWVMVVIHAQPGPDSLLK